MDPDWVDPRRDTTTESAATVLEQSDEIIAAETCPGTCDWRDGEVVTLPPANGHYPPEFLSQVCASCQFERMVASPEHPAHDAMVFELNTRINTIPDILTSYTRGE